MKSRPSCFSSFLNFLLKLMVKLWPEHKQFALNQCLQANRLLYVFPVLTCASVAFDQQIHWRGTIYQLGNPTRNIGVTRVLLWLSYRRLPSLNHDSSQARRRLMFFFSLTILLAKVYIILKYWSSDFFSMQCPVQLPWSCSSIGALLSSSLSWIKISTSVLVAPWDAF